MSRVEFGGSLYPTVKSAAAAWAIAALPEPEVIEPGEDAGEAAAKLEEFW